MAKINVLGPFIKINNSAFVNCSRIDEVLSFALEYGSRHKTYDIVALYKDRKSSILSDIIVIHTNCIEGKCSRECHVKVFKEYYEIVEAIINHHITLKTKFDSPQFKELESLEFNIKTLMEEVLELRKEIDVLKKR